MAREIEFVFNGNPLKMMIADHWTLLHLIREELGYTGTKQGCGSGECGACTVIVDGEAVNSCLYLAAEIDGKKLTTIEGLAAADGTLHPIQKSFVENGGIQCGFCSPGMIMSSAEEELKDLAAAGFDLEVRQFDIGLPMGNVTTRMTFGLPESDRASFTWSSLLLGLNGDVFVSVPESLVQLATSMDPQAGALVGMGYLSKDGDVYTMDAKLAKGLLTINGAPVPLPLGAF